MEKTKFEMTSSDIMVSYNWSHQFLAIKIKKHLSEAGFSVWMDVNEVYDSINKRMAEAVKGAKIIVLCVTEQYEVSHNCIKEYKYVDKLQKPFVVAYLQKGYRAKVGEELDFIISDKLYYALHEEVFEENISKLIEGIKRTLNNDGNILFFSFFCLFSILLCSGLGQS